MTPTSTVHTVTIQSEGERTGRGRGFGRGVGGFHGGHPATTVMTSMLRLCRYQRVCHQRGLHFAGAS
jgi:hypothetical protein